MGQRLTEPRWQAIVACDGSYDRDFYYGVTTTRIFCRPSCKSRTPVRDHVRVFLGSEEALAAGFRPCKRCKPGGLRLPDEEWVQAISGWLDAHLAETVTLERLAETFHASPFHLQRTFKRVTGLSPAAHLLQLRLARAADLLRTGDRPVSDIAASVGIPNPAYFATLFARGTGMSPTRYREQTELGDEGDDGFD